MSPLVYPFTRNSISSGESSSPPRLRWIKSTVRIMSNLAYHPKGLKVKEGLCRPGTNRPFPDVSTSDFGQFPLNSRLYTLRPRHSGFATRFRAKLARERRHNIGSVLLERRLGTRAKREDCFAQRTQRAQRRPSGCRGIRDDWRRVHLAARVGSGSSCGVSGSSGSSGGRGRGRTKRGSPLGQKRLGCPGMLPAGDGFGGFGGFGGFPGFVWGGVQVVSFGSGWASKMASFGNWWRRRLRRSNSSTARRYMRSDWAWERRKRVKLGEYLLMGWER